VLNAVDIYWVLMSKAEGMPKRASSPSASASDSASTSKEYSLRNATSDDIAGIVALERKLYPLPWTEDHFSQELTKPYSHFLVMTDEETDEEIAGYIVFWLMFDQCEILNVAVAPERQRRGFAQQMVRKAVDLALKKNLKKVVLNVRKSNAPAIELYQKLQFGIVGVRKAFYSNREDAYELSLPLDGALILDF
jgi:ribosomal-protein-alanine N-acetyltransferase